MYGKFVGECCRRPSSTAPEGALSLYVGGVYLITNSSEGSLHSPLRPKKRTTSARASTKKEDHIRSCKHGVCDPHFCPTSTPCLHCYSTLSSIPCYHSYSMIGLWSTQYIVVFIIIRPLYLYGLYDLYCFTRIFWVENWSTTRLVGLPLGLNLGLFLN